MGFKLCLEVTSFLYWLMLLMDATYAFDISKIQSLQQSATNSLEKHKIVGGTEASIEEYPHQVSMVLDNAYFCGGFIVAEYYIITAGHCVENYSPSQIVVRAGSSIRTNGTEIPISEVYVHPEYDNPEFDKDVAVLKTQDPIEFTDSIQPVSLPPLGRVMETDSEVQVSGWGRTSASSTSLPDNLMHVTIPVLPRYQCLMSYMMYFTENMFCAGNFFFGGEGSCQGDSGGAAVQDGMAVGIVSYGRLCGQALSPSVFADIASPEIRNHIAKYTGL